MKSFRRVGASLVLFSHFVQCLQVPRGGGNPLAPLPPPQMQPCFKHKINTETSINIYVLDSDEIGTIFQLGSTLLLGFILVKRVVFVMQKRAKFTQECIKQSTVDKPLVYC